MSPAAELMPKFFVICGAILVVTGVAQVFTRRRKPNETRGQKIVNAATMKAVLFVTVGVLGVLLGLGVIPLPRFR
jgi:hypothetical protein